MQQDFSGAGREYSQEFRVPGNLLWWPWLRCPTGLYFKPSILFPGSFLPLLLFSVLVSLAVISQIKSLQAFISVVREYKQLLGLLHTRVKQMVQYHPSVKWKIHLKPLTLTLFSLKASLFKTYFPTVFKETTAWLLSISQ